MTGQRFAVPAALLAIALLTAGLASSEVLPSSSCGELWVDGPCCPSNPTKEDTCQCTNDEHPPPASTTCADCCGFDAIDDQCGVPCSSSGDLVEPATCPVPTPPGPTTFSTDPHRFGIVALTQAKLFGIRMCDPGCNVAVDCDINAKNGPCGVLQHDAASYRAFSQVAAGKARFRSKSGLAAMHEVYTQDTDHFGIAKSDYKNVCVGSSNSDGRQSGDRPSCGPDDETLTGDSLLLRFPYTGDPNAPCKHPYPEDSDAEQCLACRIEGRSCDIDWALVEQEVGMKEADLPDCGSRDNELPDVIANKGADCVCDNDDCDSNPVDCCDVKRGDDTCDVKPGSYRNIRIGKKAKVKLVGDATDSTYRACKVSVGRRASVVVNPGVEIHTGDLSVDKSSCFNSPIRDPNHVDGQFSDSEDGPCGAQATWLPPCNTDTLRVFVHGGGKVNFGANSRAYALLYAPQSKVHLGKEMLFGGKILANWVFGGKRFDFADCCQDVPMF